MQKAIVSLGRLIKAGFINFKRNGLLSAATVAILSLNLLILGGLIIFSVATEVLVKNLEEKIEVDKITSADRCHCDGPHGGFHDCRKIASVHMPLSWAFLKNPPL